MKRLKSDCIRLAKVIEQQKLNTTKRDIEIKLLKKECSARFDRVKRRDVEIEILELSVKKRDEMLIKYEEIIKEQKQIIKILRDN